MLSKNILWKFGTDKENKEREIFLPLRGHSSGADYYILFTKRVDKFFFLWYNIYVRKEGKQKMNATIQKAINDKAKAKAKKNRPLRKWWQKNSHKVYRVILFPVWVGAIAWAKVEKKLNDRNQWSEQRADEILSYYVPHRAEWDAENNEFYFFDNGRGWSLYLAKDHLRRKDRRFWELHNGAWGGRIRDHLIYHFELEGFTKEVLNTEDFWTEIAFKENKEDK